MSPVGDRREGDNGESLSSLVHWLLFRGRISTVHARTWFVLLLFLLACAGCGKKSTDELIEDLKSPEAGKAIVAVRLLQHRKGDAAQVVPALIEALKDNSDDVRSSAAIGLGYFGEKAKEAIPALEAAQKDRDARVREAAGIALCRIDPEKFPPETTAKAAKAAMARGNEKKKVTVDPDAIDAMKSIDASRGVLRSRIQLWMQILGRIDVFPEFSRKVRALLYNPLGVLLCTALVALLCGFFLHWQCFVLFGSVLAVIVLGSAWPFLTLRMVRGTLSFEQRRATEGERVQSSLTICNRMFWPAYGLALRGGMHSQDDINDSRPLVGIASAPARRTIRCGWVFTPRRRGVYPLSPPRLSSGFPFGLWQSKREVTSEVPLLVWPRTYLVAPMPTVQGDQQLEGVVSRSKVGNSGDVLGIRPYRRGDSTRRIHWAQSVRHDRLIVCELQANARPVVQLILDTHSERTRGRGRG